MLAHGERAYGDASTPYTWLSSIALLPWLPGFPPQAFPTTISSLTSPRSVSLQLTAAPCPGIAPQSLNSSSAAASRGPVSLSRVCKAVARTAWFSFHLGCHGSAVSLSALNASPLTQTIAPVWGLDPCFLPKAPPILLTLLFFPLVPSSYLVLCGSIYSFHWLVTPACSQLVFCMHLCG